MKIIKRNVILVVLIFVGIGTASYSIFDKLFIKSATSIQDNNRDAKSILFLIKEKTGSTKNVEYYTSGYLNKPEYVLYLSSYERGIANSVLTNMNIGKVNNPYIFGDTCESAYENWRVRCAIYGLGTASSPSDLRPIWCSDKVGIQEIRVTLKDIEDFKTDDRTFVFKIGSEAVSVQLPDNTQSGNYKDGSFEDFLKEVIYNENLEKIFWIRRELKGDIFEVIDVWWVLG